jgi:hypothetical protein
MIEHAAGGQITGAEVDAVERPAHAVDLLAKR